jgi:hypothetical protein
MIAPRRKTVCSSLLLVLVGALAGCTSYYEIPIETPIQPKLDTSQFQRVFVAGFVAGGNDDIDGNLETVRLLRSQLRQKGSLRVVDSEPLQLTNIATEEFGIELAGAGLERRHLGARHQRRSAHGHSRGARPRAVR